jgi:branched-chain amino acid transport system substrate-binding protein
VAAGSVTGGAVVSSGGAGAAAASGTGGGGGGGVSAANRSPIKLGHIGTYSGVLGALFAGGQQGIQAWGKYVNAHGGLNGHPVQITTADDGGDPSRNLQLTRNMVENQGVIAFVGNMVPLSLAGSQSYLEQHGIPLVGGDTASQLWWESPIYFPQGGTVVGGTEGSATVAVKRGGPSVGLLYCAEASGCFTARDVYKGGAVERSGGHLVYSAQISLAQPNFTSECLQMSSAHVQAAVVAADSNTLSRIARDCKQQGLSPRWVSFGIALVNSIAADSNLNGLVGVSSAFPWFLTNGPGTTYGQAMSTYAPNVVLSGTTSDVWVGGAMMQEASKNLPAGTVKSSDILEGLYAFHGNTIGGLTPALTFRRGQPAPPIACYLEIGLQGGHFNAPNGFNYTCK